MSKEAESGIDKMYEVLFAECGGGSGNDASRENRTARLNICIRPFVLKGLEVKAAITGISTADLIETLVMSELASPFPLNCVIDDYAEWLIKRTRNFKKQQRSMFNAAYMIIDHLIYGPYMSDRERGIILRRVGNFMLEVYAYTPNPE